MRVVLQRCLSASVTVDGKVVGEVGQGLVALVGIGHADDEASVDVVADKTAALRIFNDEAGKMNRSVLDIGGDILVVSQFTLLADCRRGRRPAFTDAAPPDRAKELVDRYAERLRQTGMKVPTGIFGADMKVQLINDGPVTIVLP